MPGLDRPWDEADGGRDSPKPLAHGVEGAWRLGHVGVLTREERLERAAKYRAAVDAAYRVALRGNTDQRQQLDEPAPESPSIVDKYPVDYISSTHEPPMSMAQGNPLRNGSVP
jgi:hypothetical protein